MDSQMQRDREAKADEAINAINRKAGRNMPQAVGTAIALIAIILLCLWASPILFVVLVVLFMIAGLWELRVDFATINLHIPLVTLWICSTVTLLAVYFLPTPRRGHGGLCCRLAHSRRIQRHSAGLAWASCGEGAR